MNTTHGTLTETIDELKESAKETPGDKVKVGQLIDALDERGYGPVLAVLPLIEISPLGGIPGFPTALAVVLALVTVRLLMGYEHLWVPDVLRRRQLPSDKVEGAMDWLKPVSARIDGTLNERLSKFAGKTAQKIACIVILCLLVTVPPLELLPFATTIPMLVIAVFGLGLLYRDGLLMLIGFLGAGGAAVAGIWYLLG